MALVAAFVRRHDAQSAYFGCAALLLALTLVVDLLFHDGIIEPSLTWTLLLLCFAGAGVAFWLGRRMPRWVGLIGVAIFIGAQAYYLGLADDPQSVISSAQQLPIVAFYLGWFIRPRPAGILMLACLLLFGAVMSNNPLFAAGGAIGAPVAVHALLAMLFCYGAGLYLWSRQASAVALDPLTGVLRRQVIMERVAQGLRRYHTRRVPFCLVIADFDHFKALNDSRGHAAGDAALCETVAVWRAETRANDRIGRIGGDEFLIILPRVRQDEASQIVDRLKQCSPYPWSAGIAEARDGDTPETMLERADLGLYVEKKYKQREGERRDA